jgi:plasmid stability protein
MGGAMPQVLVRSLEEETIARLKAMAAAHGRSLEAEMREILRRAARPTKEEALALADEIRARTRPLRPGEPTAAEMIREDRDTR